MVIETAVHLTGLINDFRTKKCRIFSYPALIANHTCQKSLNFRPVSGRGILYFLFVNYFSLEARRFLMVLTNSFETPR